MCRYIFGVLFSVSETVVVVVVAAAAAAAAPSPVVVVLHSSVHSVS